MIKDQTTGLLNQRFTKSPIRSEMFSVVGNTVSESPTSGVVMSEASALRLAELNRCAQTSWQ
jgi:hypothetical protein